MYIISKKRGIILNFDNFVELYTGTKETAVVAKAEDGKGFVLEEYETRKEAVTAIAIIAEEADRKTVVYVPDAETVKSRIVNGGGTDRTRHIAGKRTKGYGGS